jgi:hypothetical protein
MLTLPAIARLRLQNQQIARSRFAAPQEVVAWHGAMQAQDYTHAKWAVGLRLPEATDALVEQAVAEGAIVRTHVLRPTWHFVAAADIRWMLALTGPVIDLQSAARQRELGLDAALFRRTNDLIARALEGGNFLTRKELAAVIERAGIGVDSSRMVYIMFRAELDALVCNGPRRGKEQTYALMDERLAPVKMPARDEALAMLARRYFQSHAPATLQDFTWWSGLRPADARAALESVKSGLAGHAVDHLQYWIPKDYDIPEGPERSVHLLPAFDEFMISYKERGASLDPAFAPQTNTFNGIFRPIVVVDGRVAGLWSRTEKKSSVVVETTFFTPVGAEKERGVEAAAGPVGPGFGKK